MKDYPIQRMVRDARITNIYEGTSQLQVVAAIRGVTTGHLPKYIHEEYEAKAASYGEEHLVNTLRSMTSKLEEAVQRVTEGESAEYTDFHARRLVEICGYIIMGYLMLQDAERNEKFEKSARIFIKYAAAKVEAHSAYIDNFSVDDMAEFST